MVRSLSFILWALESLWSVSSKWVIIWFAVAARQTTDDRGQEWKQTEHSGGKDGYDMDQKVALPIPFSTPSAWHSLGQSRSLVNISWVNKYLAKPTRLTPFWEVQEGWPKKIAEAWATHDVRAPAAVCSPEKPPHKAEWAVFSLTAQTVPWTRSLCSTCEPVRTARSQTPPWTYCIRISTSERFLGGFVCTLKFEACYVSTHCQPHACLI